MAITIIILKISEQLYTRYLHNIDIHEIFNNSISNKTSVLNILLNLLK